MTTSGSGLGAEQGTARLWLEALATAMGRQLRAEWFGSPPHLLRLSRPRARAFAAFPRDFRPARADTGRALLSGVFDLGGRVMMLGAGGDPWDRTSPSRTFAVELHKFGWLRHLNAAGEAGARESLRLVIAWARTFGRWNAFSWSGEVLERRVFNLACNMGPLAALASDAEVEQLAGLVARQARQLLMTQDPAGRAAERAAVAAAAAAMLDGRAGQRLLAKCLDRLNRLLPVVVLPDGGHVSRAPEAGMELLFDLLALDDGWAQRGLEAPLEAARAIDRLTAGMRFYTLADGRLARFQGGAEADAADVAAARAHDDAEAAAPAAQSPHSGYQRIMGKTIQVMVDSGTPAPGVWSLTACAQTSALEVVCGGERLITNAGWTPRIQDAQALRLTDGGSTAALGHGSSGRLLDRWPGRVLGPRLVGGPTKVDVRRAESEAGIWLDVRHDGWAKALGITHERRLFVDFAADELRGEDLFNPITPGALRVIPYMVHFHLPPDVEAAVARDNQSILLRGPSQKGWWLRNDAVEVRVEPSIAFKDGRQITSHQVLLMGHLRADKGGRVRWKLTAVE